MSMSTGNTNRMSTGNTNRMSTGNTNRISNLTPSKNYESNIHLLKIRTTVYYPEIMDCMACFEQSNDCVICDNCDEIYCKNCILEWNEINNKNNRLMCPSCKTVFTKYKEFIIIFYSKSQNSERIYKLSKINRHYIEKYITYYMNTYANSMNELINTMFVLNIPSNNKKLYGTEYYKKLLYIYDHILINFTENNIFHTFLTYFLALIRMTYKSFGINMKGESTLFGLIINRIIFPRIALKYPEIFEIEELQYNEDSINDIRTMVSDNIVYTNIETITFKISEFIEIHIKFEPMIRKNTDSENDSYYFMSSYFDKNQIRKGNIVFTTISDKKYYYIVKEVDPGTIPYHIFQSLDAFEIFTYDVSSLLKPVIISDSVKREYKYIDISNYRKYHCHTVKHAGKMRSTYFACKYSISLKLLSGYYNNYLTRNMGNIGNYVYNSYNETHNIEKIKEFIHEFMEALISLLDSETKDINTTRLFGQYTEFKKLYTGYFYPKTIEQENRNRYYEQRMEIDIMYEKIDNIFDTITIITEYAYTNPSDLSVIEKIKQTIQKIIYAGMDESKYKVFDRTFHRCIRKITRKKPTLNMISIHDNHALCMQENVFHREENYNTTNIGQHITLRCSCGGYFIHSICNRCGKMFNKQAIDDSDVDIKTKEFLDKECKKCPVCSAYIIKSVGCSHMFCTNCKNGFDWNTGKLLSEREQTNTLYHEWLQTINGDDSDRIRQLRTSNAFTQLINRQHTIENLIHTRQRAITKKLSDYVKKDMNTYKLTIQLITLNALYAFNIFVRSEYTNTTVAEPPEYDNDKAIFALQLDHESKQILEEMKTLYSKIT